MEEKDKKKNIDIINIMTNISILDKVIQISKNPISRVYGCFTQQTLKAYPSKLLPTSIAKAVDNSLGAYTIALVFGRILDKRDGKNALAFSLNPGIRAVSNSIDKNNYNNLLSLNDYEQRIVIMYLLAISAVITIDAIRDTQNNDSVDAIKYSFGKYIHSVSSLDFNLNFLSKSFSDCWDDAHDYARLPLLLTVIPMKSVSDSLLVYYVASKAYNSIDNIVTSVEHFSNKIHTNSTNNNNLLHFYNSIAFILDKVCNGKITTSVAFDQLDALIENNNRFTEKGVEKGISQNCFRFLRKNADAIAMQMSRAIVPDDMLYHKTLSSFHIDDHLAKTSKGIDDRFSKIDYHQLLFGESLLHRENQGNDQMSEDNLFSMQ